MSKELLLLTFWVLSASTLTGLISGCGKSNLHSSVIRESDNPGSVGESDISVQTTTSTTTTTITETTTSTLTSSVPPNAVTTTTIDLYPDQVSRNNRYKIGSEDFDPSLLAPGTQKQDFVNEGEITPTVYFNAILKDDETACAETQRLVLHGTKGEELAKVCPVTMQMCSLQGSCTVVTRGKQVTYNVINRIHGVDQFIELNLEQCPYGLGVRSICLDPFYSVAADLKLNKPGDVIFIPSLVGHELINGRKHTGFFVVRDQGRGIVGKGRFDFFSGFYSWRDPLNPFARAKLPDSRTKLLYYRVTGESQKMILQQRAFPGVPSSKKPSP